MDLAGLAPIDHNNLCGLLITIGVCGRLLIMVMAGLLAVTPMFATMRAPLGFIHKYAVTIIIVVDGFFG